MSYNWNANATKLKNNVSITDYISKHVSLDKSGKGICPFHDDSNPSMHVSETKGMFKCFSCGVGGDVIKFHSLKYSVGAKESFEALAKEYGVDIEPFNSFKGDTIDWSFTKFNDIAAEFFQFRLMKAEDMDILLDHIKTTRKLSEETLQTFGVGVCKSNAELKNVLFSKFPGGTVETFIGLLTPDGRPVFGGRIVFPLYNRTGDHVLGFSGRKVYAELDDANHIIGFTDNAPSPDVEVAKYINSSNDNKNHEGYYKGNYIYGYHLANSFGELFVVEGYYDVLAMYEMGYKNTVSIGGTALTPSHLYALSNRQIILALDFDRAGIEATLDITQKYYYNNFKYGMFDNDSIYPSKDAGELIILREDTRRVLTGNLYDYIEFILNNYVELYLDPKVRYDMYKKIVETVDAIAVSPEFGFMASDIRLLVLKHFHLHEPDLTEAVGEFLEKLYKKFMEV